MKKPPLPLEQTAASKRDKDEADISVDIMHRGLHSNLEVSAVPAVHGSPRQSCSTTL